MQAIPSLILALAPAAARGGDYPDVSYVLTYDHEAGTWEVEMKITELSPEHPVGLRLDDWGEWTEVDSYFLRVLEAEPPIHRDPDDAASFVVEYPKNWDGTIEVRYRMNTNAVGSRAEERHGLLPSRAPTYSGGFTSNTLMRPMLEGGVTLAVNRTLEIVAPRGWTVFTGWGGIAKGRAKIELEEDAHNTFLYMGKPVGTATGKRGGIEFEVVQFGPGDDWSKRMLDASRDLVHAMAKALDYPPRHPVRIGILEPGGGGTRVEGGIMLGQPYLWGDRLSGYSASLYAHELHHLWLGGYLSPHEPTLQWFFEGFTEYFALWYAAQVGLIERAWFAERLGEHDRESTAIRSRVDASFADGELRWRGGDVEDLAYKGGAILAFHADATLRAEGRPGLIEMMRDFLHEGDGGFSHDSIRSWMETHGLADFYERHVVRMEPLDLGVALESIGYEHSRIPTKLTYVGIRLESEGADFGRIAEVDPESPAGRAGLRAGDRIGGYYPTQSDRPRIDPSVDTPFRFGLDRFAPEGEGHYINAERGGEELHFEFEPRLIDGGYREGFRADDARLDGFFRYDG